MQHKKTLSTLIIAILTFSIIAAFIPMASAAITSPTLDPTSGPVETSVKVSGGNASVGGLVEVYWENLGGPKLNQTYANGTGYYECNVTILEGYQGSHDIIVKDVSTGSTAAATFTIQPEIELTPTSGLPGDSVDVSGTGFAANENITLTFEGPITNETIDNTPNGSKLEFSGTLEYYPIKNGTLEINATVSALVQIDDLGNGTLKDTNVTGTIDYDTGAWVLTFTTNAPDNDTVITANYTIEIDRTTSPPPKTSILGSFSSSFTVPTVPYGDYLVNATDKTGNFNATAFNVTATITLTPDKGPTGKVVTITGKGFTETADLPVTITVDGVTAPQVAPIKTKADGTFTGQFIVPTVIVAVYDVVASDGPISATKSFNVTKTTTITLNPAAGQPGWSITIEGLYFTAITDTEVTVKFQELTVKTLYTNATGGFKGTFDVPSFETGSYTVNATDENGLKDTAGFTIAITLIFLTPSEGPTGTNVTIAGYGFTKISVITANVTIGTLLVKTDIPVNDTTGRFTATFIVPTLPAADYTVTVVDSEGLTAKETFSVTMSTELIIMPSSAYPGYTGVSIVGNYFSGNSTVDVVLYNATDITVLGNYTTFANGTFTETFNVPEWDIGDYYINATDTYTFPDSLKLIRVLEIPFSIVTVVVQMETRSLEYLQGDTISFYIKSDLSYNITIQIKDPNNYPYGSIPIVIADWKELDEYWVVPYDKSSFTLPSDAVLDTWNWTATIGTETTATGLFDIVEKPTLSMILDRLGELDVKLSGLITDSEGNIKAYIDTSLGPVLADLDDIDAKLVDIKDRVIVINTTLGEVRTIMEALNLTAINAVITSLNQTIATISSDIGTVTVNINDIGLKVVAINGTVATIKTDLGTMQGTVTSIDDDVATIKTDVGTVKADVSDIGVDVSDIAEKEVTVDLTPVWIAVVFSILAFIVAIATAYMLRSKLA